MTGTARFGIKKQNHLQMDHHIFRFIYLFHFFLKKRSIKSNCEFLFCDTSLLYLSGR